MLHVFDSGPEVFVRVNRNHVLTEYVLNEHDCIKESSWLHSKSERAHRQLMNGDAGLQLAVSAVWQQVL